MKRNWYGLILVGSSVTASTIVPLTATAGNWSLFGRRQTSNCGTEQCTPPVVVSNCSDGKCPKEKPKPNYYDPPTAPVVTSVPAMMIAQPAVAVPAQRLDTLLLRDEDLSRTELRQQIIKAMAARLESAAQQQATTQQATTHSASPEAITPERLRKLEEQLLRMEKETLPALQRVVEQLDKAE